MHKSVEALKVPAVGPTFDAGHKLSHSSKA